MGQNPIEPFNAVLVKMCNLSAISVVEAKADGAAAFMVGTTEYAVPLGNLIDVEAEIARMEAELKHKEGFLQGVLKKLSNEKFVARCRHRTGAQEAGRCREHHQVAEGEHRGAEESISIKICVGKSGDAATG